MKILFSSIKEKLLKNIKIKQELKDKTTEVKEEIKGLFIENCVFYHEEKTKTSMKNKWVKIMDKFFLNFHKILW